MYIVPVLKKMNDTAYDLATFEVVMYCNWPFIYQSHVLK